MFWLLTLLKNNLVLSNFIYVIDFKLFDFEIASLSNFNSLSILNFDVDELEFWIKSLMQTLLR